MEFTLFTKVKFRLIKALDRKIKNITLERRKKLKKVIQYCSVPFSLNDL